MRREFKCVQQMSHVYCCAHYSLMLPENVFVRFRNTDSDMSRHCSADKVFHTTILLAAKLRSP